MACIDCFNNCDGKVISDKCVKYTGIAKAFLGINPGDPLSEVQAAIIDKLEEVIDGSGITLADLTSCTAIDTALGSKEKTLYNIVQALYTVICTLRADVDVIKDEVGTPSSFDTECLTGLPASPTKDDILQGVLSLLCSISTTVNTINGDYITSANLCSAVAECLASSASTQENTKMPKYCPLPYYGPLSVFDSQGNGISGFGYDKVYLCLGQVVRGFNVPDMRGRVPMGANFGVPGGAMDSAVDPSANPSYVISKGLKKGEFSHVITNAESPSHTHSVTDPGHTHTTGFGTDSSSGNNHANFAKLDSTSVNKTSNSNTTGITINSSGGGQAHNNVQPSLGVYFIIYIP